jgi:hypothetical protein
MIELQNGEVLAEHNDIRYSVFIPPRDNMVPQYMTGASRSGSLCVGIRQRVDSLSDDYLNREFELLPHHDVIGKHGFFEFDIRPYVLDSVVRPSLIIDRVAIRNGYHGRGLFQIGILSLEELTRYNGLALVVREVVEPKLHTYLQKHNYRRLGAQDYVKVFDDF